MRFLKHRKIIFAVLLFVSVFGVALVNTKTAEASHGTIPSSVAPAWVIDTIHDRCINRDWNIVQLQWISPRFSASATSTTVESGATSVALQLNRITYRCRSSTHSYGSSQVVSTSPSIAALNGLVSDMPYPASPNTYESSVLKTFDYPGNFNQTQNITLTLNTRGTTTYTNGTHYCAVVDDEDRVITNHQHNFTPQPGFCVISSNSFTIKVYVVPKGEITGSAGGRCSTKKITGTAVDGDSPNQPIIVRMYVDGEYKTFAFTNPMTKLFEFDISAYTNARHEYWFEFVGVDSSGHSDGKNGWASNANPFVKLFVGPCASTVTLTCPGSVSPSITNPEPGEPFMIRVSFNVSGGSFSDPARNLRITSTGGLNISGALTKDYQPEPVPNGGSGYADFGPATAPTSGNYTVTYELTGGTIDNCQGQIAVRTKPYFRVYGGDVMTGLGFGSSCSVVADSKIIAFNKGSSGGYAGAGVQLADYALGKIDEFSSATHRTSSPLPAKGLSFSNSDAAGEYGGNWKGGDCTADFFAKAPTSVSGPLILPAQLISPGPAASSKITTYVDGDVFIDGDITYADGFAGLYTPDTMPSFRLVVKGNIFVGANVSRLDGLYIVQPSSSPNSGRFYTCAFRSGNSFSLPNPTQQIDSVSGCGRKLTVFGSVLAQSIKLLRTNGTLRGSTVSEGYTAGNQAETFIYTPEVWLGLQGGHGSYDSYTGLPPVL